MRTHYFIMSGKQILCTDLRGTRQCMREAATCAAPQMCSIVLPGMKARKRGAIVNIGSGSATFLPSYPLYAVYGATKVHPLSQRTPFIPWLCSALLFIHHRIRMRPK